MKSYLIFFILICVFLTFCLILNDYIIDRAERERQRKYYLQEDERKRKEREKKERIKHNREQLALEYLQEHKEDDTKIM